MTTISNWITLEVLDDNSVETCPLCNDYMSASMDDHYFPAICSDCMVMLAVDTLPNTRGHGLYHDLAWMLETAGGMMPHDAYTASHKLLTGIGIELP